MNPNEAIPHVLGEVTGAAPHAGRAHIATRARLAARVTGVVLFAALTALSARVAIPLPDTPVPITLQTLVVVAAGLTLGPRLGLASMAFYLLLGACGYHVFSLGQWGLATVAGATGGYLLGFALCQPLVGWMSRRGRIIDLIAATLVGNAVIFACGVPWLGWWLSVDAPTALRLGFWPFAVWALVKGAGSAALAWPLRGVRRWLDGERT